MTVVFCCTFILFTDSDSAEVNRNSLMCDMQHTSTHNENMNDGKNRKSSERRSISSKNEIDKIKNSIEYRGYVIMNAGGSKVYAHSQILDMNESKIMRNGDHHQPIMPLAMESSIIVSQPSSTNLLPLLEVLLFCH